MTSILSHNANADSPFVVALSEIASGGELAIACPYIHLDVLRGLVAEVERWRLLTDLPEWLTATPAANREATAKFISQNLDSIRDVDGLHAKLVLGDDAAYLGSANLTMAGLGRNHELGVVLDRTEELDDLSGWYDGLWSQAQQRTRSDVEQLAAVFAKHDESERLSERVRSSWNAPRSQRPSKSLTAILSRAQGNPFGGSTSSQTTDGASWQRLVERVRLSPGRWWADRFFDLVADLLETTGLESGDPRLATTIPTSYKQLSVSINNRLVLRGMKYTGSDIGFMVGQDFELAKREAVGGFNFKPNSSETELTVPRFVAVELAPGEALPVDLLEHWRFYASLEKEYRSGSMFQKHHEPVVCRVAQDRELRTQLLDEAFPTAGQPHSSRTPTRTINPPADRSQVAVTGDAAWNRLAERIRLSPGRWWADRFFELVADLLETTGLESGDPRLVTTIPRSGDRLCVPVNNRYVLTGMWKGNRDFGFMVGMDYEVPHDLHGQIVYPGYGYTANANETDDTVPRFLAFDIYPNTRIPAELLEQWRFYVNLEKDHRSGSMFQKHHESVVCRVAQDRHLRAQLLDEAFGA